MAASTLVGLTKGMQRSSRCEARHALVGSVAYGVQAAGTFPKVRDRMGGRQLFKLLGFAAVIIRCAVHGCLCDSPFVRTLLIFLPNLALKFLALLPVNGFSSSLPNRPGALTGTAAGLVLTGRSRDPVCGPAAMAFLHKAIDRVRLPCPASIGTDGTAT